MQATGPDYSPFDRSSTEVVDIIFRKLHDLDPSHLRNVTLVSKEWHVIAQRIIDERVEIAIGSALPAPFENLMHRIGTDKAFAARIRHVHVREWYSSGYLPHYRSRFTPPNIMPLTGREEAELDGFLYQRGRESSWDQIEALATVLEKLNLSRFIWTAQPRVPKLLLAALSTIPNCMLEISPCLDNLPRSLLPGLYTYSSLVQLQTYSSSLQQFSVIIQSKDEQALQQLGIVIASSRRLKSLAIFASGRFSITDDPFIRLTDVGWLTAATTSLPKLTKLELSNVCVCVESSWRTWFKLIQSTHLMEAHFSCASFIINGASALSHIRKLSLHLDDGFPFNGQCCPAMHPFEILNSALHEFDRLQELKLRNGTQVIDLDLLIHLGKTLVKLDNRDDYGKDKNIMGNLYGQMGSLGSCLRDLTINAPYSGEALRQLLDTMNENLPSLKRLHLHFEYSRISGAAAFMGEEEWEIGHDTCHSLWHYLSRNECVSNCSFKMENRRPKKSRMNLEMLNISAGNIQDYRDFERISRYYGKTWIVVPANSTETCVDIRCPEMDTVGRRSREDGEHANDYSDRLEELKSFAKEPPKEGVWVYSGRTSSYRCCLYALGGKQRPATRAMTPL